MKWNFKNMSETQINWLLSMCETREERYVFFKELKRRAMLHSDRVQNSLIYNKDEYFVVTKSNKIKVIHGKKLAFRVAQKYKVLDSVTLINIGVEY